jgi:Flp pilus assembly protein TadG
VSAPARRQRQRRATRGQALVEFSLIVPLFLLILFGMMEFGFIFTHDLTLEYATREGARAGSALDNGGGQLGCNTGQSPNWQNVDPLVIAAVERVLQSPGSQVVVARVTQIVIYDAKPDGTPVANTSDVWTYAAGGGPTPQGSTIPLNFKDAAYPNGDAWKACARSNAAPTVDSIGVSLTYTYDFVTPLASVLGFFGGGNPTLTMNDRTVMVLNPSAS